MKHLVIFIERKLEKKDHMQLSFYTQPDAPLLGNGEFKSSILVPGEPEAFYVGQPSKEKLGKNSPPGAVLVGTIAYGTVTSGSKNDDQKQPPVSYQIGYVIPPMKIEEDKGKDTSSCTKSISERLEEEVRDAKIKILSNLKRGTEEERSAWDKFSTSLKSEYPKYTPLLAKILEGILPDGADEDKVTHNQEIINAANEVIDSIDKEELAKCLSVKPDPEDEDTEKNKKKMEATRDQLAEALYRKGLALAEILSFEQVEVQPVEEKSTTASNTDSGQGEPVISPSQSDKFEENFKEIKKWVDIKSSKYAMLSVLRERRSRRLGTALKVLCDMIQDDSEPPKKKLYDLKIELLNEIGWTYLVVYEKQWMYVRFPSSLPLF